MDFLRATVNAIVNQNYQNWEVIVVDYGGTDSCKEILECFDPVYKIRYIHVPEYGVWNLSRARNVGIKNAFGDLIVSLDSDIILGLNTLEVLNKHFEEHGNKYSYQIQRINLREDGMEEPMPEGTFLGCFQATSKENFMKIHGYNEFLTGYGWEDKEVLDRLERIGVTQHWLQGTKIYHQYHPSNPGMETWPNRFKSLFTWPSERPGPFAGKNWGCATKKRMTPMEWIWKIFDYVVITTLILPAKTFKKLIRMISK